MWHTLRTSPEANPDFTASATNLLQSVRSWPPSSWTGQIESAASAVRALFESQALSLPIHT